MDNNIVVGEASDLLIPHDLSDEAVLVMYSYQTNQNQCVRICNTYSKLETNFGCPTRIRFGSDSF